MALTDEAIEQDQGSMITSGELGPGDRLPKEADLAERLGLSRNSLREAVKALSMIRVLDVRQGDGTYATSLEPSLLLDALSFIVDFHRDDTVLEFLEIREDPRARRDGAGRVADVGRRKRPSSARSWTQSRWNPRSMTSSPPTLSSTSRSRSAPATRCSRRSSTTCRCRRRAPGSGAA